jgi:hypothetical protein
MSLTEKGYRERKWGPFPALRQALEDKKIPFKYNGLTSAHDNMFEAMDRLIEISILVVEYEKDIRETAQSVGREEIYKDLENLFTELEGAAHFFERKIEEIRRKMEELRTLGAKL